MVEGWQKYMGEKGFRGLNKSGKWSYMETVSG